MPQREEESLIEEMRAAIRGDRERAAGRGGIPMFERPREPEPPPEREPPHEPPRSRLRRLLGR